MKIYTRTGDTGTTALIGGTRVSKCETRIDSYGTVDELNALLGMVRDQDITDSNREFVIQVQKKLFVLGANLATDPKKSLLKNGKQRLDIQALQDSDVAEIEKEIDRLQAGLDPMTHFVLPGGHPTVSYCHMARCVCRRAERLVTRLHQQQDVEPIVLQYLNRLSDYLFVLGRYIAQRLGIQEIRWIPEKKNETPNRD